MKNLGKIFEQNFRKSLPKEDNLFYYRLKDSASSYYGGNEFLRFSQDNIADAFLLYTYPYIPPQNDLTYLYILEFKHHLGKSLPLSCIKKNQLEGMTEAGSKNHVIPLLVVFFSDVERCFSINIKFIQKFVEQGERKSIPISYFEEWGNEIGVVKLKTNYKYDLAKWLYEI